MNAASFRSLAAAVWLTLGLVSCGGPSGKHGGGNKEQTEMGHGWNAPDDYSTPHSAAATNAYQAGYGLGAQDRSKGLSRSPARHSFEASSSMRYYWNHGYDDGWHRAARR